MTALLVGSTNAAIGFPAAMELLQGGATAIDAVVAAIAAVEANPADHSVGFGGLPNLLGQVELDASLMDGASLAAGSVGALTGYQDAITPARSVMDLLPHVLIVGDGTSRLAADTGLAPVDLLTPEAEGRWRAGLGAEQAGGTDSARRVRELVADLTRDPEHPDDVHGTVNVIARDRNGHLACGVSTSGWAWKYPGRLGDSPIIGAGNYADDRYGAAACTGRGEMAQRLCTAHSVIMAMRFGRSIEAALTLAAEDLHALDDAYASEVNIIAVDGTGHPAAVSTAPGKTFIVQTSEMAELDERERRHVPAPAHHRSA